MLFGFLWFCTEPQQNPSILSHHFFSCLQKSILPALTSKHPVSNCKDHLCRETRWNLSCIFHYHINHIQYKILTTYPISSQHLSPFFASQNAWPTQFFCKTQTGRILEVTPYPFLCKPAIWPREFFSTKTQAGVFSVRTSILRSRVEMEFCDQRST